MVRNMDEKQLRELLLERLHLEIQLFKDLMLHKEKGDIYASSYRIEVYVNLYEILVVRTERIGELLLRRLLYQQAGILDAFYEEWLGREDSFYMELRDHVEDMLDVISAARTDERKEERDGEESDKAA